MPPANIFTHLILILVLFFSLILNGCSYLPWMDEDDGDVDEDEVCQKIMKKLRKNVVLERG